MPGAGIRVVVVDDSVVVRRLVAEMIRRDEHVADVQVAANGREGVDLVRRVKPDLVTMDVEMPVMNGIEAVREIRRFDRRVPIVMFSTLTETGARETLDALAAGASDVVTKPGQAASMAEALRAIRGELLEKVIALTTPSTHLPTPVPAGSPGVPATRLGAPGPGPSRRMPPGQAPRPRFLAIGSSTGGPEALHTVLKGLPAHFPLPVAIVQHMPATFTRLLAERLDSISPLRVREAVEGMPLAPGTVAIAPGGHHLVVAGAPGALRAQLTQSPPVNSCRPSVDVMLESLARTVGQGVLAVVLTGMGQDGFRGARTLLGRGGRVWAQDAASSVVWGMPGVIATAGLAERVLPLNDIADSLVRVAGEPTMTTGVPA